jgi:hypothetical protein
VVAPDGSWLVTTANGEIKVHAVDGQLIAAMRIDGSISGEVWHPRLDALYLVGSSKLYGFKIQRPGVRV